MQDLEYLKEWIGRSERGTDYVTIPLVHRLAATLDRDDPLPKPGDNPKSGDRPLTVCGEPSADGKSAKLWVMDADNALALSADAQFH